MAGTADGVTWVRTISIADMACNPSENRAITRGAGGF